MSVVSAGYYFRIVRAMFFAPAQDASAEEPTQAKRYSAVADAMYALCAVAVLAIGIWASPLLSLLGFTLK